MTDKTTENVGSNKIISLHLNDNRKMYSNKGGWFNSRLCSIPKPPSCAPSHFCWEMLSLNNFTSNQSQYQTCIQIIQTQMNDQAWRFDVRAEEVLLKYQLCLV
ncbi:Hypothetical_protein [Hexamita inflata]|uniref:Hypothetical_protein n=1 Tax=Hexamita inflata TaxID=28002 RepID=A0AA86V1L9_9EUKA|nr:Hypothetical protein HINF_LOCUS64709 [Hexamita inflata]